MSTPDAATLRRKIARSLCPVCGLPVSQTPGAARSTYVVRVNGCMVAYHFDCYLRGRPERSEDHGQKTKTTDPV